MKLVACTCNQPQRLAAALAPLRAALVAEPPVTRWGLGYIQGGDVLLVRTPRGSSAPVDLAGPLLANATDCAIAQAVHDERDAPLGGTDNTPPFRFRRWLYAQTDLPSSDALVTGGAILAAIPEYLRRNIRGRSGVELMFHLFLAKLGETQHLDDANLPLEVQRAALVAALKLATAALPAGTPLGNIALTNGRSLVAARTGKEPLRLRKLSVGTEGEREERGVDAFRGFVLVSGALASTDGFEDIAAGHAVLISRDLRVTLAPLT